MERDVALWIAHRAEARVLSLAGSGPLSETQRDDVFWFADMTDEDKRDDRWPWQPFIQTGGCCFPLPVWFETKEACEDFINSDILTALPEVQP